MIQTTPRRLLPSRDCHKPHHESQAIELPSPPSVAASLLKVQRGLLAPFRSRPEALEVLRGVSMTRPKYQQHTCLETGSARQLPHGLWHAEAEHTLVLADPSSELRLLPLGSDARLCSPSTLSKRVKYSQHTLRRPSAQREILLCSINVARMTARDIRSSSKARERSSRHTCRWRASKRSGCVPSAARADAEWP